VPLKKRKEDIMTVSELKKILNILEDNQEICLDVVVDVYAKEVYETEDGLVYITDNAEYSIDFAEHEGKNRIFGVEGISYYEFED
jgi:hypothetical protein